MTIAYSDRYQKYSPVVSTAAFAVPFPIFDTGDLEVFIDGVETGGFSVSATFTAGRCDTASITLNSPVTDVDVEIYGRRSPSRLTNYLPSSPDLAGNLQYDADVLTAVMQESVRDTLLSLRMKDGEAAPPRVDALTTGAVLVLNSGGDLVISGPTLSDISSASSNATAAAASAVAAAASAAAAEAAEASLVEWKGPWLTATAYAPSDLVQESGNTYACVTAHTSGTFATDLAAGKWQMFAQKGAAGAGTGDVLAANNGTEFTADTFRSNLALPVSPITKITGVDILTRTYNARGEFINIGATCTNMPTGGADGDHLFAKVFDANNLVLIWYRADGTIFVNKRAGGTWTGWIGQATQDWVTTEIAVSNELLHYQHTESAGTHGGSFAAGSWVKRKMNTERWNSIAGASVASDQITLPAGTYDVEAFASALGCDQHQCQLYNVTDAATQVAGSSEYAYSGGSFHATKSVLSIRFTIAGTKVFELRHRCQTTRATDGRGTAANFGLAEVYAEVKFRKIS